MHKLSTTQHRHALVLGKFMNPHKGHIALCKYAASIADKLTVLVCHHPNDVVDYHSRVQWLRNELFANPAINILQWDTEGMCQKEESNLRTSKQYAQLIEQEFPSVDVVVGSEDYIPMMASVAKFSGVTYDKPREINPYSSTQVREELFDGYCDSAKADLVKAVHIIGPESVGKTTLCANLAKHFGCKWVPETQRHMHEFSDGYFTKQALITGQHLHQAAILRAKAAAERPLLLVDSDSLTTKAYAHTTFGACPEAVTDITKREKPVLTLVCAPTVEFVQDGTRLNQDNQLALFQSMCGMAYKLRGSDRVKVISSPNYEQRLKEAIRYVESII